MIQRLAFLDLQASLHAGHMMTCRLANRGVHRLVAENISTRIGTARCLFAGSLSGDCDHPTIFVCPETSS